MPLSFYFNFFLSLYLTILWSVKSFTINFYMLKERLQEEWAKITKTKSPELKNFVCFYAQTVIMSMMSQKIILRQLVSLLSVHFF